jgi:hypothetical protein
LAEAAFDQPARASEQGGQASRQRRRHLPNEASVKRLVGAILLEQNDEWQLQHRYMTLETMTGLSDDPIGNLPNYAIKAA